MAVLQVLAYSSTILLLKVTLGNEHIIVMFGNRRTFQEMFVQLVFVHCILGLNQMVVVVSKGEIECDFSRSNNQVWQDAGATN